MLALSKTYNLFTELSNGTYKTQKGEDFKIYEPKFRIVTSTKYKDRIPQTSYIINFFYPNIVPTIIKNNYACFKNRGVDKARKKLKELLRVSTFDELVLKVDFKDFFGSINHDKLVKEFSPYFSEKWLKDYFIDVINSNGKEVGITLGSEINQLSASSFTNKLDHKLENYKYVKYMDDLIIIGAKEQIYNAYNLILEETKRLGINISKKKTYIQSIKRPISFLGFTFLKHPTGRITMKRKINKLRNEKRKLRRMKGVVPFEDICKHYECVRATLKKGVRSDLIEIDKYFNELFKEEIMDKKKRDVELDMAVSKALLNSKLCAEEDGDNLEIEMLIREKYSMSQEICIHRKKLMGTLEDEEWQEYVSYIEECIKKVQEKQPVEE